MRFIKSPNFDLKNKRKIKYIIIHYTGMKTQKAAIKRLQSKVAKVSCHYLISKTGIIYRMVDGAVILRIILTLLTAFLLQITGLRLIGGLLLLYIVYKLYVDVIKGDSKDEDIKVDNSSFLKAIWTVLLADFTMSLDNVLGVAGAAGHHYHLLIFGLVLSIILMAVAANLISGWIKKYKWIAWIGLLAILIVAIELIYTDIKTLLL